MLFPQNNICRGLNLFSYLILHPPLPNFQNRKLSQISKYIYILIINELTKYFGQLSNC